MWWIKTQLPAAATRHLHPCREPLGAGAGCPEVRLGNRRQFIDVPPTGKISRAIALPPGAYDLFVGVKDKGASLLTGKIGVLRQELTVPALPATELSTSSVILAKSLEQMAAPLAPEKQQDNPYVFGPLKVQPSIDGLFAKAGELQVLFWIYGASHTAGKPDVQVDFSFFQRLPEGEEKYFNRTNPQELNAKTLPVDFNLAVRPSAAEQSVGAPDKLSRRVITGWRSR